MIDGSSNIDVIGGEFNHNIRGFIDYPASCIRIDTNTANSKVMYVKSHDCESAGFVLEDGANNNLIAYNLFYNNARGGSFSSVPGQNNKIYNNVFYNNVGSDSGGLAKRSAVDVGAYEFTQVGPPQQCSDGTLYGQCSVNIPLYCSNGQLINNCQQCGCPQGQTCQANGSCLPQQNQPPIATITQPTQTSFTVNTSINYAGTGSDPEQCNLPGSSLCWSYDITGDQQSFINL